MKKIILLSVIILAVMVTIVIFRRKQAVRQIIPKPAPIINQTPMEITSSAFAAGQPIPKKYTCDGDGVNPPLAFAGIPSNAQSLAFILDDPDAPGGTWTHWTLWGMNPTTASIPEHTVPSEAMQGKTSSGQNAYGGPCPPSGTHHYHFKLFALDTKLAIPERSTVDELLSAMQGHVIGQAELIGTYTR